MASDPIPVLEVSGTHRRIGQQIGEEMRPTLERILDRQGGALPPGVEWKDMLLKGRLCLAHSRAAYPQFVEEVEGVAEGSGLPFENLFLELCEELWERAAWHVSVSIAPTVAQRPCHGQRIHSPGPHERPRPCGQR